MLHALWQKLPRPWRQELFHTLTSLGVPRPGPLTREASSGPVVVAGVLRAATGLGQAARLAVYALREARVPVTTFDVTEALFQKPTEPFDLGTGMAPGPGTLLLFVTPPNVPLSLRLVGRENLVGKLRVGAWVCETERLPPLWPRQAAFLHRLAAPSPFARDAIAAAVGRPVHPLTHPVEAEPWPPVSAAVPAGPTVGAILDVGSSAARKNVAGLIACCTILLEQEPDIRIVLKTRDLAADPAAAAALARAQAVGGGRLELYEGDWTRDGVLDFLDRVSLLVSFSRAEGFGLPLAEAMRRGTPVAAPIWAGPAEYLDSSNAVALPFTMIEIADSSALYGSAQGRWADVDAVRAAALIGAALRDRGRLAQLAAAARDRSRELFNAGRFAAQLAAAQDAGLER